MAGKTGTGLEQALVAGMSAVDLFDNWLGWSVVMNVRYAVVGCCFVAAAILLMVSANSNGGKDECRNWSARSIMSLFTPCVAKVEVNDPLNIGTAVVKQPDSQAKR